jgi:hypothetical protein
MTRVAAWLAAVLALAPLAVEASLCKRRNGAVVERTKCRKREVAVDLAAVGAVTPGEPGAAGASHPRVRAVDANGTFIGFVNTAGEILMLDRDRALYLGATGDGFTPRGTFYYEASGCTGPPLVFATDELVRSVTVYGTTAYVAADAGQKRTAQSSASSTPASTCMLYGGTFDATRQLCCHSGPYVLNLSAAVAIDLSHFVPPFHVEVDR